MKIQNSLNNEAIQNQTKQNNNAPSFKSAALSGILSTSGRFMQGIENGGFLASFLIQDGIGMTCPRTAAGFLRDKEITGEYNMQEGFEVLGREGLTGPCMMAVAPACLFLAAKFAGRSTSVNTQLIKRFGNSLKEIVSKPDFDKSLLSSPEKFKDKFYRINLEKMLSQTLGKENTTKESVDFIIKELANRENIPAGTKLHWFRGKAKYRDECMENIINHINDIKYKTTDDLNMLRKVKFGSDVLKDEKLFATKDVVDAMVKYTDDAIVANKKLDKLDELTAESIKNKSLAKRIITNISMMATTLGVLSVLPKIYARSNTAPGARKNINPEVDKPDDTKSEVSFKGKPKLSWLERLGRQIDKIKSDFVSSELEYNGHNFTNSLMAGLSIFGLLIPRGLRAYNRAQVDENGKKDYTELWEIILRDLTSSLAVVFAVPMLTRACVTSYEKNSGFVLMHKDRTMNKKQTIMDLLNPYSKSHVLTNAEITALYDNVNTRDKMINFCKYIDKNGGDLHKILSKSANINSVFNEATIDFASLKGKAKTQKNQEILSVIENLDKSKADELVKKLMTNTSKMKKIASFARGLNSVPGLLTTFVISPYLLGWAIPRLTYANTRRIHEKEDKQREEAKIFSTKV